MRFEGFDLGACGLADFGVAAADFVVRDGPAGLASCDWACEPGSVAAELRRYAQDVQIPSIGDQDKDKCCDDHPHGSYQHCVFAIRSAFTLGFAFVFVVCVVAVGTPVSPFVFVSTFVWFVSFAFIGACAFLALFAVFVLCVVSCLFCSCDQCHHHDSGGACVSYLSYPLCPVLLGALVTRAIRIIGSTACKHRGVRVVRGNRSIHSIRMMRSVLDYTDGQSYGIASVVSVVRIDRATRTLRTLTHIRARIRSISIATLVVYF